jgi:hypothetical protein
MMSRNFQGCPVYFTARRAPGAVIDAREQQAVALVDPSIDKPNGRVYYTGMGKTKMTTMISADRLKHGDYVMWLGRAREVSKVRRSLGNGWIVTFVNGLTANMSTVQRVQSAMGLIQAPNLIN